MTCIHTDKGLCPACQALYDEDPDAYWEFGDHPDGLRRRAEEEARIATWEAERWAEPQPPTYGDDVPL